jgi:small GTP-binding protein
VITEAEEFQYDVFLSYSSNDKKVVLELAERLKRDGLRVWFDAWEIKPGDSIPAKIENGLELSRALLLCMSANAFGSDWAQLESGTFRFRDPLNTKRRLIPLRLDEAKIKGSLAQFLFIDWHPKERAENYSKLLEACRVAGTRIAGIPTQGPERTVRLGKLHALVAYGFHLEGRRALTGGPDFVLRLWDLQNGRCLRNYLGHSDVIYSIAWSADRRRALSGSKDGTMRLWDVENGVCLRVFQGQQQEESVNCVAWSANQRLALSTSQIFVKLWDIETGTCLRIFEGHFEPVGGEFSDGIPDVAWSPDERFAVSSSCDLTARLWDIATGNCIRVFEGHTESIWSVAWTPDQRHILTGGEDRTMRLWDAESGKCLRVFEGHQDSIRSITVAADSRRVLTCSYDKTIRLWDLANGRCLRVFEGHRSHGRPGISWSIDQRYAISGDADGLVCTWDLSGTADETLEPVTRGQTQYTNAKVLLIGESGAGKTGLSKALAGHKWTPSDSTIGAWATQWKLNADSSDGVEREIWLWDFGGQADQRLIHQLYMEDAALAALVFDGQKANLFETLGQWDRDLSRASSKTFEKLLVAGRVDAGGLRVSRERVKTFAKERNYSEYIETSAKDGTGCEALKMTIQKSINWEAIPKTSSLVQYKRLKEEIIRLKDEGRVLMRFNELREALQLRLIGEMGFSDENLRTVIGLLSGPGVVWNLSFGSWVLLQPEHVNAYGQAVIYSLRKDEHERGCILEEQVLNGELSYPSAIKRLGAEDERIILLAMHQMLVQRGLCMRLQSEGGALLVFPTYFRRERPELTAHPAVLASYRFNGFLDDIYATLVVRLHHTSVFEQDALWRYAADFKTVTGKQVGVKLTHRGEGAGELEVYCDPAIDKETKIVFSRYIHEHLLRHAREVTRLRHYVCDKCQTPVENREVAMRKLMEGKKDIVCVNCEDRVPLWDEIEKLFASEEIRNHVLVLEAESTRQLDSESKERAHVGEVISTVALAGQISRELTVSDHGIDMEIEFKTDDGKATGKKLYLQLKSGDSHLSERKSDGAEIFKIEKLRHADYWREQAFPVFLVIRNSKGETRWMEISEYLNRESRGGAKPVRQIIFAGERFDVMSIRRWREKALADTKV